MTEYGSEPIVSLGGSQLRAHIAEEIRSAVIESDLVSPSECRIEFSDRDAELLGELGATIGSTLEVRTSAVEESSSDLIFSGTIFSLEYRANERGGHSVIVGYDDGWKLRQRRGTRSFQDMTDSGMIEAVCKDSGIDIGTIVSTSVTYPYVAQLDESDWDFIARRAAVSNRIVRMRNGKLQCTPPPDVAGAPGTPGDRAGNDPLQLVFGANLSEIMVRQSAASQVPSVQVRAWDPQQKAVVSGTCRTETKMADTAGDPAKIAQSVGAPDRVLVRPSLTTTAQCEEAAKSAADAHASALTFAEARATGDPRFLAGTAVSIGMTGPFDGSYVVTTARHVFDDEGYFTEMTISGRHDLTAVGLATPSQSRTPTGYWPATVTKIDEKEGGGLVRVSFPWLDEKFESNWSRVAQIGAGMDKGIVWLPEVDDEVLVTFIDGDVSSPVVVGGLYNGKDAPPVEAFDHTQNGAFATHCLRTRHGHTIELRDVADEERISIQTGNGKASFVLEDGSDQKIVLEVDGDLQIEASGKTMIKSGGDLSIESGGKLTIDSGGKLEVNGGAGVVVSGPMIDLN